MTSSKHSGNAHLPINGQIVFFHNMNYNYLYFVYCDQFHMWYHSFLECINTLYFTRLRKNMHSENLSWLL